MPPVHFIVLVYRVLFKGKDRYNRNIFCLSHTERIYYDNFWLMFDNDKLVSFVDGFCTDEPDLTDIMYARADMHNEQGDWQMIFGVNTIPSYRNQGLAGQLIQQAIADAKEHHRSGFFIILTVKLT